MYPTSNLTRVGSNMMRASSPWRWTILANVINNNSSSRFVQNHFEIPISRRRPTDFPIVSLLVENKLEISRTPFSCFLIQLNGGVHSSIGHTQVTMTVICWISSSLALLAREFILNKSSLWVWCGGLSSSSLSVSCCSLGQYPNEANDTNMGTEVSSSLLAQWHAVNISLFV